MIKPLTSLRFFFALMVFTSHLGFVQTHSSLYKWIARNVFFEGYLGVSFFFILSGFILTYSYENKILEKEISIKKFYVARFARIYPLHLITLLLILPFFIFKNNFSVLEFLSNLTLTQSFVPLQNFYTSFNAPSWSISDEMFFYLLFPFYLIIFNKKHVFQKFLPILIGVFLLISITLTPETFHKSYFYINPISRSLDFILGILLYKFYKEHSLKIFYTSRKASFMEGFSIIIFLLFFAFHNFVTRGFRFSIYYWIPMCLIIYTFAHQKGFFSKILSASWLVLLGEISFGFYMIHYLVLEYGIWFKETFIITLNDISYTLLLFLITVIISLLSYKLYEKPMNSFVKRKLSTYDS
ncbi:acyltransferase family protein [Halpernia sp. GG3]